MSFNHFNTKLNIQLLKLNVHSTLKADSTIKIECLLTIQHKVEHATIKIEYHKVVYVKLNVLTTIIPSCRVRDCWRGPCGTKKVERPLQSARLVVLRRPRHQLGAARLQGTSPPGSYIEAFVC